MNGIRYHQRIPIPTPSNSDSHPCTILPALSPKPSASPFLFGMALFDGGSCASDKPRILDNSSFYPKVLAYSSRHDRIESPTARMQSSALGPGPGGPIIAKKNWARALGTQRQIFLGHEPRATSHEPSATSLEP